MFYMHCEYGELRHMQCTGIYTPLIQRAAVVACRELVRSTINVEYGEVVYACSA